MLEEKEVVNENNQVDIENMPPFKKVPGYKDWLYRLTLFIVGLVGLEVVGLVITFILAIINVDYIKQDSALYIAGNNIINSVRYTIILAILVSLLIPRLKTIIQKFKNWKTDLIGLAFGAALILSSIGYNFILSLFIEMEVNANQQMAEQLVKAYPVISIIVLGVFGPVCEEITYRYGLFSMISKKSKVLAYIIVILVFAFIHFDFTGDLKTEFLNLPSYIMAGGLLCLAYHKFGFNAAIIAHVTNNLFAVIETIVK